MKRVAYMGVFALASLSLASCDYQKNNTIRQEDFRKNDVSADYKAGDPEVYGRGKDSAAVQSTYKYTPNPELDQRTQKIREKLFGNGSINQGA
ncbi:hypothetical protein FAES_0741 [Fibrella aestuarina BUZ 2]|uniref:Lipoprotein n=1 Tax=Fibrella aestuarina BUZ 2 TaxID=1166018 RepID=I0K3P9_9BACT|nr:hypothetical protein [Fibrella aestuarina]CCG98752.1 hypothetical protein FAES_0741 [Fibrella aestuarina BUZ 2]